MRIFFYCLLLSGGFIRVAVAALENGYYNKCHNLPGEYTELEYLEGTGPQWIDTGFYGNQETKILVKFITLSTTVITKDVIGDTYANGICLTAVPVTNAIDWFGTASYSIGRIDFHVVGQEYILYADIDNEILNCY